MVRSKPRPRRQRRKEQRAKDKQQQQIQHAMTNDLLDTVLADYTYQDNPVTTGIIREATGSIRHSPTRSIPQAAILSDAGKIDNSDLNRLHQQLFPADTASRMQLILDKLAGKAFPTSEANNNLVLQINQILAGTGLQCIFNETSQRIRLRFINPPRSRHGYFQLRTSDAQQQAIFTKAHFPSLLIAAPHR